MDFCTNLCMDFCPNFCTDFLSEFPYRFLYGFLCRFSSLFVTPSFPISVVLCRMLLSQLEPTECNPFPTFPPLPPLSPPPRQLYRAYTAFPDFFRNSTVEWWSTELQEVYENPRNASLSLKYDGIWIVSCPSLPFFGVPFCCVVVDCGCVWDIVCS